MPLFEGDVPHINDLFDKRTGTGGLLNRAILRPPQNWRLFFMNEAQIRQLPGIAEDHFHRTIGTLNNKGIMLFEQGASRSARVETLVGLDNADANLLTMIDLNNPCMNSRYKKGISIILATLATYDGIPKYDLKLGRLVALSERNIRERMELLTAYSPAETGAYVGHLKLVLRGWDLTLAA